MLIPTITLLPQAPQSSSPANFRTDADVFVAALNIFDDEMNEAISGINAILPSLDAASSAANFKGDWASVTTYAVGQSVFYLNITYMATQGGTNKQPDIEPLYWMATGINTLMHNAITKINPVNADEFAFVDSADSNILKKLTWSNLKAALFGSTALTGTPTKNGNSIVAVNDYASDDGKIGGTVKARINGTTLYLTTNGANA